MLQAIGRRLRRMLRDIDYPCRYGGEEFVAILTNTGLTGALTVAERFRSEIEASEVDGLRVTLSIGVAALPDMAPDSGEALLEAADAALYQAKRDGRNQVRAAEAPGQTS